MISCILELEEKPRVAMLRSDIRTLDTLIDDELCFIGPDGDVFTKQDDLELHRSGTQKMIEAVWKDVRLNVHGSACVSLVTAQLKGMFRETPFQGSFRYLRVWRKRETGWRIVAGSVSKARDE